MRFMEEQVRISEEALDEMLAASTKAQLAMEYFHEGYNCSQAVFLAFSEIHKLDKKMASMLSSSFGGGMGRLREVCGAVSGMFMVLGAAYGYDDPKDSQAKKEHYERIQELAKEFRQLNNSIICRDLLGIKEKGPQPPTPEARTQEYYQKRPCSKMVGSAAMILERYLQKYPV